MFIWHVNFPKKFIKKFFASKKLLCSFWNNIHFIRAQIFYGTGKDYMGSDGNNYDEEYSTGNDGESQDELFNDTEWWLLWRYNLICKIL